MKITFNQLLPQKIFAFKKTKKLFQFNKITKKTLRMQGYCKYLVLFRVSLLDVCQIKTDMFLRSNCKSMSCE